MSKFVVLICVMAMLLSTSGSFAIQEEDAKLTVNFGKLIRHSLGAGPEKKVKLENAPTHSATLLCNVT